MPLIDPTRLLHCLGPATGRFDVDALDECDSTSSELQRRLDQGAPAGTVIVADRQYAGRGRRGRRWQASPEASLTFSLAWRFATPRLAGLSLAIGVAIARALDELGARNIRLKWPNDVLLLRGGDYAKLAGILIELLSDRRGTQAIIGIGINLLPPQIPDVATAGLSEVLPLLPDRHDLLATLLRELAAVLDAFTVDGFAGLKSAWLDRHAWQDLAVTLINDDGSQSGICRGVSDDGALLLEQDGRLIPILAGDVSLRRA